MEKLFDGVKYFVLDLDGTVYIDGTLIGDMKNTLNTIRKSGRTIVYLTNNSSRSIADYITRLTNIGIYEEGDIMFSSGVAVTAYLKEHYAGKKVHLMATDSLRKEILDAGITLVDENSDVAVMALDSEMNYQKIVAFDRELKKGADYIITHPDTVCPAKDFSIPDVGSFVKMFESSSGRLPMVNCGKPERNMGEIMQKEFGASASEFVMVGDRLYTDIKFGLNCGYKTILVLSGETSIKDYEESGLKVTLVLDTLNDVLKYL